MSVTFLQKYNLQFNYRSALAKWSAQVMVGRGQFGRKAHSYQLKVDLTVLAAKKAR